MTSTILNGVQMTEADFAHGGSLWLRKFQGDDGPSTLTNIAPPRTKGSRDRSGPWLRIAMAALAVLAGTSAIVSYQAQFLMVMAFKDSHDIAALQAGIPDAAALVFASLGIALALHGKRAVRARLLNIAAVATSITMNALAAGHGWKALAIWTLAPVAYAVTSDTLIGVIRAHVIAQQREQGGLADDGDTALTVVGKALLYGARFVVSPRTTLAGAKRALIAATPLPEAPAQPLEFLPCPVVPVIPKPELATAAAKTVAASRPKAIASKPKRSRAGSTSKTGRFLALVEEHHGALADIPVGNVYAISQAVAPEVGLHTGSARTALRKAILRAGGAR